MKQNNKWCSRRPVRTSFWLVLVCTLTVACTTGSAQESELPLKRIAIVRDQDSQYFDGLIQGFSSELEKLAAGQYRFEVLDEFNAQGEHARVPELLSRALNDSRVDVIYAAGVVSTSTAARMDAVLRVRPVVGGAIEFADLDDSLLGGEGNSALSNYTFVRSPRRIPADLERFAQLAGTRTIHALVGRSILNSLGPALEERVRLLEERLDLELELVPGGDTAEECLSEVPEEARAVYVSLLVAHQVDQRRLLFQGLAKRKIASFSIRGSVDVELGALAGLAPDNRAAVRRRMALNLHQILSGIPTELLPVTLKAEDRLTINMRTALAIGWSPDYDTSLAATFVEEDSLRASQEPITLEQALALASTRSAQIRAAQAATLVSESDVDVTRSNFFPQAALVGSGVIQGVGSAINRLATPRRSERMTLGAEVTQLLFSDRLASQIHALRVTARQSLEEQESERLDSMEEAGLAFLDVLLADALYEIDKQNLLLIENNLQLAKLRRDIGAAESAEVFRWESSQAQSRSQLIQRDANRRNARVRLNVALAEPRNKDWNLRDIVIEPEQTYFLEASLLRLIRNQREFELFLTFIRQQAASRAPEIRAFENSLEAQGILLSERRRRNFLPEVSLSAAGDYVLQDSTNTGRDSEGQWSVGIGFSIPIFEGGLRNAELKRFRAGIQQLSAQRDAALYLVEQRALAAGFGISASHPAMRLSRLARQAAERNYDAVQNKYSQGAASIIDLLDAQSELLTQRQSEVAARYQYLSDVVSLQRSIAWFEFARDDSDRQRWLTELEQFLARGRGDSDER